MMTPRTAHRRAAAAVIGMLVVYAVLVLANQGEFWPFSVFPMYSKGRESWARPLIIELPQTAGPEIWRARQLDELPGDVFSLFTKDVDEDRLRMVWNATETWTAADIVRLRPLIGENNIRGRRLLVMDVRGEPAPDDGVSVICFPLAVLTEEGTLLNPSLGP